MDNKSIRAALKKNAMLIILLLVYLFFLVLTKGSIFWQVKAYMRNC